MFSFQKIPKHKGKFPREGLLLLFVALCHKFTGVWGIVRDGRIPMKERPTKIKVLCKLWIGAGIFGVMWSIIQKDVIYAISMGIAGICGASYYLTWEPRSNKDI